MRLPLRRQILWPLAGILVLTLVGVSVAHAWLTSQLLEQALDDQLQDVVRTLREGNFPLEANVLRQVKQLSGAELVVRESGSLRLVAASAAPFAEIDPRDLGAVRRPLISVGGEDYQLRSVPIDRRARGGGEYRLEIYYPERTYRAARRQAIVPSLVVGALGLALAVVLAGVVAARVTRPVQVLKQQTEQIASGDFTPVEPPSRDDELRDLSLAVNRMATMLQASAEELRRHERTQTLHQVGAGIAHQLRNAATGCRMALDLFRRESQTESENENLQVAARQLELMESYLQRFLTLGRTDAPQRGRVDLGTVVAGAVALVRPLALHLGTSVDVIAAGSPPAIEADAAGLEQVMVNLLTNAVEAASVPGRAGAVRVSLASGPAGGCELIVSDNGPGLSPALAARWGEPFVTDKPQGTGLGLAVAKEIVVAHRGRLSCRRRDAWTEFIVELPGGSVLPAP